jgi:hypothetical protein
VIHKNALQNLPEDVRAALKKYERGSALSAVVNLPGWKTVLAILQEEIEDAERKLLKFKEPDPQKLFLIHAKLQGMRELLSNLEVEVASNIALMNDPPESIQHLLTY